MARHNDKCSEMIHVKYFEWIRNAIVKHGRVNVQSLASVFNISPGNTYFRNFVKDKNSNMGISGLNSLVDSCGYTFRLVPIKKVDMNRILEIEQLTNEAFKDIRDQVSDFAYASKKSPVKEKSKGPKIVENANLINMSIMSPSSYDVDDMFDDDDDDILTGNEEDMFKMEIDPNLIASKI